MANKLLVIANPFPPSGPIGWSVRARKWCQYLPRHGWEPTVLTGPFHYQVKCPPLDSVQVVGKASDALSRPIPRWAFLQRLQKYTVPDPYVLRWLPLAVANGRSLIRQKNFDAILSSSPVNTCHLVALALHRQTMKPWIADFRDPWVGNSRVTRPAWAEWLNERQEAMVIRRSTVVTCAAAAHLEQLRQGYPECAGKLVFLPNGFDPTDFLEVEPICPSDAAFNLLHAGHISGWRRALLSPLFEALTKLPTDIRMWFIGETKSAEVEDQIRRFRLEARVPAPHKGSVCLIAEPRLGGRLGSSMAVEERVTFCRICEPLCGMVATVEDGRRRLEAEVVAGRLDAAALLPYAWARVQWEQWLREGAMGVLATRHLPVL